MLSKWIWHSTTLKTARLEENDKSGMMEDKLKENAGSSISVELCQIQKNTGSGHQADSGGRAGNRAKCWGYWRKLELRRRNILVTKILQDAKGRCKVKLNSSSSAAGYESTTMRSSSNKPPQLLYAFPVQNKFDLLNGIQETGDGATVEKFGFRKQKKTPKLHPVLNLDALIAGKKKLGSSIVPGAMLSVKYHKAKRNKVEKSKEESFDSNVEQMAEEQMKKKTGDDVRKDDGSKKEVTTSSVEEVASSPKGTGDGGINDPETNGAPFPDMDEQVNLHGTERERVEEVFTITSTHTLSSTSIHLGDCRGHHPDLDVASRVEDYQDEETFDGVERTEVTTSMRSSAAEVEEVAFSPRSTGDGDPRIGERVCGRRRHKQEHPHTFIPYNSLGGLWDKKTGGPGESGEQTNSLKETVDLEDTSESEEEEMDLCTKWNRRKTKQRCKKFEMGSGIPCTLVSPSGALDPLLGKSNDVEAVTWKDGSLHGSGISVEPGKLHSHSFHAHQRYNGHSGEASSHHRPEDPNIQYWRTKDGEWLQLEFVGENDEECFVDWISKAMKANNRDNTETRGLKRFPPPSLIPDGFFWNQFNGRLHRKLRGGREVQEVVLKGRAIVSYYDEISDEFYKFREDWMDDCTSRELVFSRRLVTPCEEITPRTPFKSSHIKLSNETVQFYFHLIDDRDEFISGIEAAIRHMSDPNKFPVPKPHTLLSYETESGVVVINEGDLQSNSNSRNLAQRAAQRVCTPDSPCINLACLRCLPLSRRRMRSPARIETARQETRDRREVTAGTRARRIDERQDEEQRKRSDDVICLEKEKGRNNLSFIPADLIIREDIEKSMWQFLRDHGEEYPEGLYLKTSIWRDFCNSRPTPMEISSPYLLMAYFHTKMVKELVDSPLQHNLMLQIHQDLGVRMDDRQRLILESSRNIKIQLYTHFFVESWKPVTAEAGPSNGYSLLDDSDAMDFLLASPQPAPRSTMASSTLSNRSRNPPVKSTLRLHQRQDNRRTSL
ncbi:unnamed protein product [Caenorhabditis brenneri]